MGSSGATTVPEHGYVTSRVTPPSTSSQATAYGRDVDGDGHTDNQLGSVLAALNGMGMDFMGPWRTDVATGKIVMLQSLRAVSLATDRKATWQVWYGVPVANPNFTGSGTFKAGTQHSARIPAKIVNHHLSTSVGTIPVRMDVGRGVFSMPLVLGRAFAICYAARCSNGRINGAFRSASIDAVLYPRLAQLSTAVIQRDCPTAATCADGSQGRSYEDIFDTNHDLTVTTAELQSNDLVSTLFAPDLDLFKADGTRGTDGKRDSISFGFGFGAVKARIVH